MAAPLDKKYLKEEEHEITAEGNKRYTICGMRFETTPEYAVRKAVGQGAYGLVCSGRNVHTNKLVALKKIPKAFEDTVDCKRLLREIKILRHFKHDNVLGLLDILPPPGGGSKEWKDVVRCHVRRPPRRHAASLPPESCCRLARHLATRTGCPGMLTCPVCAHARQYIVSELMDTDLHYIIHSKQPLTDEHFKYFLYQVSLLLRVAARTRPAHPHSRRIRPRAAGASSHVCVRHARPVQILRGVHAIHTAHVLHRDLKPGNLLVNKNCDLKICDFGLARAIDPSEEKKDLGLTECARVYGRPRPRTACRVCRIRSARSARLLSRLLSRPPAPPAAPPAEPPLRADTVRYVVTRWYRAPELLVENQSYTTAIDVWAVGCIFAEMLGRKALFPGRDYLHQLRLIIDVLGTPSEADLACITNQQAVQFLRTLPVKPRKPWTEIFPNASPQALDLLNEMLVFDPAKRCTMVDALNSEYMAALHQGRELPQEEEHFSFGFEKPEITQDELRDLIWKEMGSFHPDLLKKG